VPEASDSLNSWVNNPPSPKIYPLKISTYRIPVKKEAILAPSPEKRTPKNVLLEFSEGLKIATI
jgi:hypothetical protein